MPTQVPRSERLTSIDALRGLGMVLMALDHGCDMATRPQGAMLDFSEAGAVRFLARRRAWWLSSL